jgi:hypothetical protein
MEQAPLQHWVPAGRRLVLVDIENLVGGSGRSAREVDTVYRTLRQVVGCDPHDVWVVACGCSLAATAGHVFGTRLLVERGIDGADRKLLEQLDPTAVVGRYASVVLASGDARAFTAPVIELADRGVATDLFIGAGRIGHQLYAAARSVTSLVTGQFAVAA